MIDFFPDVQEDFRCLRQDSKLSRVDSVIKHVASVGAKNSMRSHRPPCTIFIYSFSFANFMGTILSQLRIPKRLTMLISTGAYSSWLEELTLAQSDVNQQVLKGIVLCY